MPRKKAHQLGERTGRVDTAVYCSVKNPEPLLAKGEFWHFRGVIPDLVP